MIRKLVPEDVSEALNFLGEESAFNLFIIGDIENFGIETDFQAVWGEFNDQERLVAVMLRYFNSYVLYADSPYDASGFSAIIIENGDGKLLSGKASVVSQMEKHLHLDSGRNTASYFCTLREFAPGMMQQDPRVKSATEEDIGRILKLYELIKEFGAPPSREMLAKNLANHAGRIYFIEDHSGNIVSMAQSTAENSRSAMIVGVATDPRERRRGLASACVSKLCQDLLAEGKEACLFYSNPQAGRIYKRLGFNDIGMWNMYTLNQPAATGV